MSEIMLTTNKTPIEILLQVGDDKTVSARNVYEFLELDPSNYSRWCDQHILKNRFAERNIDFLPFVIYDETPTGGKIERIDYRLSISFAKKLCMVSKSERGEAARDYFIKIEELHKETKLALNSLSPQLQLMINMELKQKEMEKQIESATEKITAVENTLTTVQETIIQRSDDWRESMNKLFNKAVEASGTKDFRVFRQWTYEILDERGHCNVHERLRRLRERLIIQGATKTKIKEASVLDVIEADPKLKEIYTIIVKELAIKYLPKAQ